MSQFHQSIFGSLYLIIYGILFVSLCIRICYQPLYYRPHGLPQTPFNNDIKLTLFNLLCILIETLLTLIMILISFFVQYDSNKVMIITLIGFYHYITLTLPYYKSYLLMKYIRWMQSSFICDFVILQSNHNHIDMLNRFYCCLHQISYHDPDMIYQEESDDDIEDTNTENVNLLIRHKPLNDTMFHQRNSKQCIKLQAEFMDYNTKEKWTCLYELLDKIKSMKTNTCIRYIDYRYMKWKSYSSISYNDLTDPFHFNKYINYIYWILSFISLFYPFIWMPFIGDTLYMTSG
eukprot:168144_1